jgi:hypothetical protein
MLKIDRNMTFNPSKMLKIDRIMTVNPSETGVVHHFLARHSAQRALPAHIGPLISATARS